MKKGRLLLMFLPWLTVTAKGQDSCFLTPMKLFNVVPNPTFENSAPNCTSGFTAVSGWYVPTNEVAVAFLNACTNFNIADTTTIAESLLVPNVCLYPIVPQPIPSGNGVVAVSDFGYTGDFYVYPLHKSYISTCLLSPLRKDSFYLISFYVGFGAQGSEVLEDRPGNYLSPQFSLSSEKFSVFALPGCSSLDSSSPIIGCPTRAGWQLLGTANVGGQQGSWAKASILLSPTQDVQAIALGPSCDTTWALADSIFYKGMELHPIDYSFFLNDIQLFVPSVPPPTLGIAAGTACTGNFLLQMQPAAFYAGSMVRWFRNDTLVSSGTASTLSVNQQSASPAWYFCQVSNDTVCLESDSVYLDWLPTPNPTLLGTADTLVCVGDTILLQPDLDTSFQYLWQDGSTASTYSVSKPGEYKVTISNACGSATAVKNVQFEKCTLGLFVPNAFTPNGDGINDIFKPLYQFPPVQFKMTIYNRYGREIFSTSKPSEGWDGTLKGFPQPVDTYVWTIDYADRKGEDHFLKGTVVLIR